MGEPQQPPTNVQAQGRWSAVIEDMEATAATYRDRGWTTLELHPGDSVLVNSEQRTGLDVVLPGPEYKELEALLDTNTFREVEVFRADSEPIVHLLIIECDPDEETAVFIPAYYDAQSRATTIESIRKAGTLTLFCRRLNNDTVTFVHDDPTPFLPER